MRSISSSHERDRPLVDPGPATGGRLTRFVGHCILLTAVSVGAPPSATAQESGFALTITGDEARSIDGRAVVYPLAMPGGRTVPRVVLYDMESEDVYFLVHLQPVTGTMPGPGQYPASPFGAEGFLIAAAEFTGGMPWLMSAETTGTVTITHLADGAVQGSLLWTEPDGGVTLAGGFYALPVDEEDVPEAVR